MQNNSSETLLRGIFLYLLLNVKYLVFSVTLENYYIVKYTWNLLDAEVLLSLKVVKVEKSREVRETFIDIQQCHGRVAFSSKGWLYIPQAGPHGRAFCICCILRADGASLLL